MIFRSLINEKIQNVDALDLNSERDINVIVDEFNEIITDCANECIRTTTAKT